tara:strand:- start:202 stop:378 length:177 start_codon:yes stop_codon:yes gene_type:complete
MSYTAFLKSLEKAHIDKYIIIKRKDYLRQVLSGQLGLEWKKYHFKKNEKPSNSKIKLI